jgi:excisionase family DNA binding protein
MDADAAAAYLGYPSRKALYQAVRRGLVPVHHLGRRLRFNRAELDQLLLGAKSRSVLRDKISGDARLP